LKSSAAFKLTEMDPPVAPARLARRTSLISRRADFWLMGGASLVIWAVVRFVTFFGATSWSESLLVEIGLLASVLSYLVFQPHFIFTYRIAYGRGWRFTLEHWPQLLGVPALLIFIYLAAYFSYEVSIENVWLCSKFPQLTSMTYGQATLSLVLSSMFVMLGWHHSKQTFGCMMAYRRFDEYPVSASQRRWLLSSMYGLWMVNVVVAQAADQLPTPFYGIPLFSLSVLEPVRTPIIILAWILVASSLTALIFSNWRKSRILPSANFLMPLAAILVWWAPPFYQRDFYVLFSTVFHALQYWPFAVRFEKSKPNSCIDGSRRNWLKFIAVAVVLGALPIFVPMLYDRWFFPESIGIINTSVGFFVIAVQTSLNIHHYFLDSAIWRYDQPRVRESICGEPAVY
jgi:hypothetical protein